MKDDVFRRVLMKEDIRTKSGFGTPCVKDATEVLRKQVVFGGNDDIKFCSGFGNPFSTAAFQGMIAGYIRTF